MNTNEPETIGHMLTRLRLTVEDRGDSDPVRREILARFEALERACDAVIAGLEREAAGRREEAQRAADLSDEVQRAREECDALREQLASLAATKHPLADELQSAEADLAAARAEAAQLAEQLRQVEAERDALLAKSLILRNRADDFRELILAAIRGER